MNKHGPHATPLRLGVTDLSFHRATAALITQLLQQMGFVVQRCYAAHADNFAHLQTGSIDMLVSAWLPHSHGEYKARVEECVATRELGLHYQPYALWGVPDYIPEAQVQSIEDLLKPAVLARMHRTIQGIGAGAGISRFSQRIMQAYGLQAVGYVFRTGSENDCYSAFEQLVSSGEWGVVPLWHPQFLHHRYRIRALCDPQGLLGGVDRAVLLAREDRLALFTPEQIQVLDNVRLSNAIVAELDYAINRLDKTPDQAASAWLHGHSDVFANWLAPLASPTRRQP